MNQKQPGNVSYLPWIFASVLAAAILGFSNAPDTWRVWGLNSLVDLPLAVQIGWIIGALIAALFIGSVLRNLTEKSVLYWSLGFIAIFLVVCAVFPAATLLRGDGQLLVQTLLKMDIEYKRTLLYNHLMMMLVNQAGMLPQNAFKLIAVVGGVIWSYSFFRYSRRFKDHKTRLFVIVAGIFTGSFPIFAGLAEYYALTQAVMALSLVITTEELEKDKFPWTGLGLTALAFAFHYKAVMLLPAFAFALQPKIGKRNAWLLFGGIALAGFIGAEFLARRNLLWPLGPIPEDGYTVFSLRHFIDMGNLLIWAAPVLVLVILTTASKGLFKPTGDATDNFLFSASMAAMAFVFLFSPDLGVARDADLLSVMAIPATTWLIRRLDLRRILISKPLLTAAVFVGLITVGAQVAAQHDETRSINRHVRALRQNPERSAYGWEVLGVHYRWKEDFNGEENAFIEAIKHSPNGRYYMRIAQIEVEKKNYPEAEKWAKQGAAILSDDFKAHGLYGYILFFQNKMAEAAPELSKAIALRSNDPNHYSMMATIYLSKGEPEEAKNILVLGLKMASKPNEQYACVFGRVEEELGNYKNAMIHYQNAYRMNPRSYWGQQAMEGYQRVEPKVEE